MLGLVEGLGDLEVLAELAVLADGALEEGKEGAERRRGREDVEGLGGVDSLEVARHERERLECHRRRCVGWLEVYLWVRRGGGSRRERSV